MSNDLIKNIQLDVVSLNNRLFELESRLVEYQSDINELNKVIEINIKKEKIVSLKKCRACHGKGNFENDDHCVCCESHYERKCTDCNGTGEEWR